jgi:uncharacterized membrane protein YfcA
MTPPLPSLLFAGAVVVAAGYVRGYGGFGFSMIAALGLSLCFDPARIVPAILLLEMAASLLLIASVWRQAAWKALRWLGLGVLVGTPPGVWILERLAVRPMKILISLAVVVLAVLLRTGFRLRRMPGPGAILGAGVVSGLLNGAAAVGGPPAILFFFSTPAGAAVSRASLIVFFLFTDFYAMAACALMGMVTAETLVIFAALSAPMALGLWLGQRAFGTADPERFRRRVLSWLIALALATLIHGLWT